MKITRHVVPLSESAKAIIPAFALALRNTCHSPWFWRVIVRVFGTLLVVPHRGAYVVLSNYRGADYLIAIEDIQTMRPLISWERTSGAPRVRAPRQTSQRASAAQERNH
jgi:hypothetical protein